MEISQIEILGRILLSGILSGIIGFEREKHGREAGLRTMVLVGMGTTTILIASFRVYYIFQNVQSAILRIDPARVAYGVVVGIGFLGAGVIIKDAGKIRGLTTAACLWLVNSIGLAVGTGLYLVSIGLTVISLFVLYWLKLIEKKFYVDIYNKLTVEGNDTPGFINRIKEFLEKSGISILSVKVEKDLTLKLLKLKISLRYRKPKIAENIVDRIAEIEDVKKVIWE